MSLSPDGRYVAFQLQTPNIQARTYDLTWYIKEIERNGALWEVDDGGDVILNPERSWLTNGSRPPEKAHWSPDGAWIYYLKEVSGKIQVWRSEKDGGVSEQLTHNEADILTFRVSNTGDKVFFTTAIPDEVVSKRLQDEGDVGFLYDDRFYPSRQRAPFSRTCSINEEGPPQKVGIGRACTPPLWVYDPSAKSERKATPGEIEAYRQHSIIASGRRVWLTNSDRIFINERKDGSVIWLENEDPEKFPGWRPPMRIFASINGDEFRCNAKECYTHQGVIEGVWWRPGGDEIVLLRADGSSESMTGLYAWVPDTGEVRTIIKTDDQLSDCQVLKDRAICLREQWTHPRTIVSVDLASGELETIYDPNPEFNQINFSKIEKIEWEDEFGNPTHGHLVYPLNYNPVRRYPLVITTYRSRGFLRGAVGDEYPIHLLAANGFMVLSHDMPRPFRRNATVSDVYRALYEDNYQRRSSLSAQERILDILDERGLIDPDRVAITGLSNGAQQVTFALIHTDRFAAAIASSAFDWRPAYYSHTAMGRAFRRRIMGGAPYEDKKGIYKAMSIALHAEHINASLLVNVSDFELSLSVESFVRLQDAGRPVEMYVFPGEFHIKWQPQHRLAIYRRNAQWLKFWLMDEEDPDAVDPDQYERWRAMRDEQCVQLKDQDNAPWYCENGEVNVAPQ